MSLQKLKFLFVAYFMRLILQLLTKVCYFRVRKWFFRGVEDGHVNSGNGMQEDFKIIILLTLKLWPDNRFCDTPVHFGSAKLHPSESSFKFISTCLPPPQRYGNLNRCLCHTDSLSGMLPVSFWMSSIINRIWVFLGNYCPAWMFYGRLRTWQGIS